METESRKVPTYALCYLVNGDATGLTEQEVSEIDRLLREQAVETRLPRQMKNGSILQQLLRGSGKPCEVIDCDIVYRVT